MRRRRCCNVAGIVSGTGSSTPFFNPRIQSAWYMRNKKRCTSNMGHIPGKDAGCQPQ